MDDLRLSLGRRYLQAPKRPIATVAWLPGCGKPAHLMAPSSDGTTELRDKAAGIRLSRIKRSSSCVTAHKR